MIIFNSGFSDGFDGPGMRLVFYLKGCNFHCPWCANPESIKSCPEILYYPDRLNCPPTFACPHNAVALSGINRAQCVKCPDFACVKVWKNPCFELAGEKISAAEILRRSLEARTFFIPSGGVTFGGGEPSLQIDDLLETLDLLRKNNIHTVVESNASTSRFAELSGRVDLLICDLKAGTEDTHRSQTGQPLQPVRQNIKQAVKNAQPLLIRIPLIAGVNDSEQEIDGMAEFIGSLNAALEVEILSMHQLGTAKYSALGQPYALSGKKPPESESIKKLAARLGHHNVKVLISGEIK